MRFGKRCFIEELGLRTKQEIQEEMKQYKSKGQRKRMDELTYHHIIARCDGGATNECNGAIIRTINHAWLHRLPLDKQEKINQLIIQYKLKFYTEAEIEEVESLKTHMQVVATIFQQKQKEKEDMER
jgi:hypothetical protein